jgi:hypothetical protein
VNTPDGAPALVGIRADLCCDEAPGKSSICGHQSAPLWRIASKRIYARHKLGDDHPQ